MLIWFYFYELRLERKNKLSEPKLVLQTDLLCKSLKWLIEKVYKNDKIVLIMFDRRQKSTKYKN